MRFIFIFAIFLLFSSKISASYKQFPIVYNNEVKKWVYVFAYSKPLYVKTWLKRSYRYLPRMKSILREKGLPEELVYMTLVESSLSSHAVSSAQAVGYWQFIEKTARRYNLKMNSWLDERKDFKKSTLAARAYLRELYRLFGDWLLVLSAYNMGENRLQKLIKKYDTKDFWQLSKKYDFPTETAQYVPKILATVLIMKSPSRYGFNRFPILSPHKYDIFYAPGGTHLQLFLKETGLSHQKFKELNPELKKMSLPPLIDNHPIRLPKGKGGLLSLWLSQKP